MKKLLFVLVLVAALTALVAGTVLAAPPTPQAPGQAPGQGGMMGRGYGMHAPGTGMGQPGTPMMGRGGMMGRGMPMWAGFEEAVAKALDMSQEDIQAARQAGQSLAQIASDKNVSRDTLVSTILTAKKADLDAAVTAGTLTQAQADAMYDMMEQQVPVMVDRTDVGPGANRGGCLMGTPNGATNGTTAMGQRRGGRWAQN